MTGALLITMQNTEELTNILCRSLTHLGLGMPSLCNPKYRLIKYVIYYLACATGCCTLICIRYN